MEGSFVIAECLQNYDSHNRVMRISAWVAVLEEVHNRPQRYIKQSGKHMVPNGVIQIQQPGGSPTTDKPVNINKAHK